jgi:hypothetical protein
MSTTDARGVFKIDQETNYFEMEYHAQMLDMALSDISMYMREEIPAGGSQLSHSANGNSPSKPSLEKPDTPLTSLLSYIELIHTKISMSHLHSIFVVSTDVVFFCEDDTRGTSLERSRTKAILKNLSMRIYYQRDRTIKSNPGTRTKKMDQYFTKKV